MTFFPRSVIEFIFTLLLQCFSQSLPEKCIKRDLLCSLHATKHFSFFNVGKGNNMNISLKYYSPTIIWNLRILLNQSLIKPERPQQRNGRTGRWCSSLLNQLIKLYLYSTKSQQLSHSAFYERAGLECILWGAAYKLYTQTNRQWK